MSAPSSAVRELVEPAVTAAGLWLESAELVREDGQQVLRIVVDVPEDSEADLDLDAVAAVSRSVSEVLDAPAAARALPDRYALEVTTRGATAPLTARRHYTRAIGRLVALDLTGGGQLRGRLVAVEADGEQDATLIVTPVTAGVKGRPPRIGDPVATPLAQVRRGVVELELRGGDTDEED